MKNVDHKKNGGLIKNWQAQDSGSSSVLTGTVVEDPAGRFEPGDRMRSSYIVSIDRVKGIIETTNSIYRVTHEIVIHKKGIYKFVRISDLHPDDQGDLRKFLRGRNAPLPPAEIAGNTAWPNDYRDFARGTDQNEGFF